MSAASRPAVPKPLLLSRSSREPRCSARPLSLG